MDSLANSFSAFSLRFRASHLNACLIGFAPYQETVFALPLAKIMQFWTFSRTGPPSALIFSITAGLKIIMNKLLSCIIADVHFCTEYQGPVPERRNNSIPGINVPYFRDNFIPGINSVPERRNNAIKGINLG